MNDAYRHIFWVVVIPLLAGVAIYSLLTFVGAVTRGPIECTTVYQDDKVTVRNCQ